MTKQAPTAYDIAIGGRLKHIRNVVGMTANEVANALGITRQTLSNYESGRTPMRAEVVRLLCDTYGVSPVWALGITDELYIKVNRCGRSIELRETSPHIESPLKGEDS